jgi:ABC-2 type transport system ATP-binding protein
MTKRPPFDPKKASRLVEMRGVSSMECYRHADGALRRVLKDVSLTVLRGEAWGVTSDEPFELALLMEIMGNVKPYEAGRCSLCEMGMMRLKRRVLDHLFYVNDQKLMVPHMRVLSWLMFASRHAGSTPAAQKVEWLELLLELDLYHVALTYGRFLTAAEQAAVALLLSLKMDRVQLVLADLSHIFVPEALVPAFSGIVRRLKAHGKSVVLASPQRDLIQHCSDHAAFLLDGALERQGTVEALCAQYDTRRLVVATDAPEAAAALERAFPGMGAESLPGEVWLRGVCTVSLAEAAAALEKTGVPFQGLEAARPSLELAFREVAR